MHTRMTHGINQIDRRERWPTDLRIGTGGVRWFGGRVIGERRRLRVRSSGVDDVNTAMRCDGLTSGGRPTERGAARTAIASAATTLKR